MAWWGNMIESDDKTRQRLERLPRQKARRMLNERLIEYLGSETLEGDGHFSRVDECANTVYHYMRESFRERADYFVIGRPVNITRTRFKSLRETYPEEIHSILVDYYSKTQKGGRQ